MRTMIALVAVALLCGSVSAQVTQSGDLTAHIEDLIDLIPDEFETDLYQEPSVSERTLWRAIIQDILASDYSAAHSKATTIDYQLVEYSDNASSPAKIYYVLEREPGSTTHYWGTFVFNPNPRRPKLVIQAPHPPDDRNVGRQGWLVFTLAGCRAYFVTGAGKCNSSLFTPCDDLSQYCTGAWEHHRLGNQAHTITGTFQLTTDEMLADDADLIFIQPHGFTKEAGDPDLIMSNGTMFAPTGTDYLPTLRDNLLGQDPNLTFKIAHLDGWSYYAGRTNTQGRLINGSADPCDEYATSSTGNFIHLEQTYSGLRDTEQNWYKLANAIALTFPAAGQITSAQSGPWTAASTWVGGIVPTAADDVLISAGHTVSVDNDQAEGYSITFGGDDSHIDMNEFGELTLYGDFTLHSTSHNVFSAGWATSAFIRFAGVADQALGGFSTSGGSTAFRNVTIDKPTGKVRTDGSGMKLGIESSLQIESGTLELAAGDDLEARSATSGAYTQDQDLDIIVAVDGALVLLDGDGEHTIGSGTGSQPVGTLTVYGSVEFRDAGQDDISFDDIDVESGGSIELADGLYDATYLAKFNPGTITVKKGGEIYCTTSEDFWFGTANVIVNVGGTYKTTAETTVFPPNFSNNGKVRYQRNPTTVLTDQIVGDLDYRGVEFSFNGGATRKLWTLGGNRIVQDSMTVNNDAEVIIDAASAQSVTVNSTLRLTTGSLDISDADVNLVVADGAEISRATGSISDAPTFAGTVDVRYSSSTGSISTGPELPTNTSILGHLSVAADGQVVTLSNDVTVNDSLTLSGGTFDNDGYTLTLADGAWLRRATGELTDVPSLGASINLEYLSILGAVTTSYEMPTSTSVLNDLKITSNQGVTLGADVTVNGTLTIDGGNLYTDGHTVTLAAGAVLSEQPNSFVVDGTTQATRTLSQSVNDDFGGLGVEINAGGGAPGATQVVRVIGTHPTIPGVWAASRYFDITPTNNSGLNATFVFHYNENELGLLDEGSISLYSSDDGGSTWTPRGGTVDAGANTVTLAGVGSFSRWTIGGPPANIKAAVASGDWDNPATWLTGSLPTSTDDVIILDGVTVTIGDYTAECADLSFGSEDAHIQMNDNGQLDIYGDFTLFNRSHNVFAPGWSANEAYVRFTGSAPVQEISGFSTTGGSTSFRDLIIDKDFGSVRTEGAGDPGMRLCLENSLEIVSGDFFLNVGDDLEARYVTTGDRTENQDLQIIIREEGYFELMDGEGTHFIRSGTGSTPIGKMTIYGEAKFYDASSYNISIGGIDVESTGTLRLQTGLGSTTYGPELNPGVITIDEGGTLYQFTTSDIWFDTTVVVLNRNAVYKSGSSTTVFPPTLINEGKVRWQRDPSSETTDQTVIDTNYYDVEFAFNGNGTQKVWTMYRDRHVVDSFIVGNSAEVMLLSGDASPHQVKVDEVLRLSTGFLDNSTGLANLALADGAVISIARGSITNAPIFLGEVDVRYTSSLGPVTTGPELPASPSALRDLTIYCDGQTVTLGADATVNHELTLSLGTFDNNGADDDFTLALADGATIRRAQGVFQDESPAFGSTVNVEYISTVAPVTTGYELPTSSSTLDNLTISGNQGVSLGSNVTVNGTLLVSNSSLATGTSTVTLAEGATLSEPGDFVVTGSVQTTRTVVQSVNNSFGGLGVEINAAGGAPGATTVVRVTGDAPTIDGSPGVTRYFDISPAVNSGLDATLVFHYHESELNGLAENDLALYSSTDGGANWTKRDGTVDAGANTVTLAGIDSFSRWALGTGVTGCCVGRVGDANNSGADEPTIGDVSILIDVLFIGQDWTTVPCLTEADINQSGGADPGRGDITIGDISYLIDYLFITGSSMGLADCM